MDVATAFTIGAAAGIIAGAVVAVLIATRRRRRETPRGGAHTAAAQAAASPKPVTEVAAVPPPQPEPAAEPAPPSAPATTLDGLARLSLDALRVGVLVLSPDDEIVYANPGAGHLGLINGDGEVAHSVLRSLAARVRRSDVTRDVELELPRGLGNEPLGVRVRVVSLGSRHVAIEVEDITEAHRVARVRRDFVANVSHELKTPVGALQLLSEALVDAGDDPEAAKRFADRILHESTRLGRLVAELLELSRLQGGEPLPDPEPVALDRIVNEVLDRSRTAASAKDITVQIQGQRGLRMLGHERLLVTAVGNLVDNAIAYSPENTTVVIAAERAGDDVEISVADEGMGIAAGDQDRIFERFYRADPARSRATGGTGLGLAIVKHIATNHGGVVTVSSVEGEGSTFTLRLPAGSPGVSRTAPRTGEIGTKPEGSANPVTTAVRN